MTKRGVGRPKKISTPVDVARHLSWLLRHINGESVAAIARATEHDPRTIRKGVREASEQLVEYAQSELMKQVFPLTLELYRVALQAEIQRVKDGKEVDWKLIDKLLKGLSIIDRPITDSVLTQAAPQPAQLTDGFDTLTGFMATKRTTPPRITDKPVPVQLPESAIIDVESLSSDEDRAAYASGVEQSKKAEVKE